MLPCVIRLEVDDARKHEDEHEAERDADEPQEDGHDALLRLKLLQINASVTIQFHAASSPCTCPGWLCAFVWSDDWRFRNATPRLPSRVLISRELYSQADG
jgi:hypothetical protein